MSALCDGRIAEIVRAAIVRRAARLGVTVGGREHMESLGDRLHEHRPSTPARRSLACDAWLCANGRWTAVAEDLADREGMELDAWLAAEAIAQGVEVSA